MQFFFFVNLLLSLSFQLSDSQSTTGCGITYNCFLYPTNCDDTSCTFIYKWKNNKNENTDFILSAKLQTITKNWLAIGFSNDAYMGDDDLVVCKSSGSALHMRNDNGYSNPVILNETDKLVGLSNTLVSISDSWLICSFTRKDTLSTQKSYYDLASGKFHVLAAYGSVDSADELIQHNEKTASSVSFDFKALPTTEATTTTTTTTVKATQSSSFNISECGVSKGCFLEPSSCKGSDCTFIFKYSARGDYVDFDLYGKTSSGSPYVAIGFSKDRSMGDDGVCMCSGTGVVDQRYNKEKSDPGLLDSSNPTIGIENATVLIANGFLRCSFSRLKNKTGTTNYFDLNNKYYMLAASGQYIAGRASVTVFQRHNKETASSVKIDYSELKIVSGGNNLVKVQAHGSLMVFAWMLFASTGIILARYYKNLLPDVQIKGLQFWFLMHRPLMVMVPVLSIVSLLIILSTLSWKWVEIEDKAAFAHSIFGMAALFLAFIQPFVAVLRPDKDSRYRFIFNHFHRTVGFSALIFSIVALFIGTVLDAIDLKSKGVGIMIGWTLWLVLYFALMEFIEFSFRNKESWSPDEKPERTKDVIIKEVLLVAHVVAALAFSISLVYVIARAGTE